MQQTTISVIATELQEARRRAMPVARPSAQHAITLDDGYAIANELIRRRLAAGDSVVGAKLGFTNPGVWLSVGLKGPLWAPVFATTYTEDAAVTLPRLRAPEVEPELVFGLRVGASSAAQDVAAQIEWWALGLEVIDTGYPAGPPVVADQAADLCAHQKLIVGPRRAFAAVAPDTVSGFTSELLRDGEVLSVGAGKNVMDSPLNAVGWFLRHLVDSIPWPKAMPGVLTSGRLSAPPALPVGHSRWELRSTLPLPPLQVSIDRPA
jgi:2-oxo-3-hexenedioate decarboxylase